MGESIKACEWAPKTVLLGKSGRHIKGISKSFFSPREKKAKAIILQLPSILPASGEEGNPGGGEVGKGTEEGIACAGRARAVLSEMSYELLAVLAPGGPVPLLSACTDTCLLSSRLTLVTVSLDVTFA